MARREAQSKESPRQMFLNQPGQVWGASLGRLQGAFWIIFARPWFDLGLIQRQLGVAVGSAYV